MVVAWRGVRLDQSSVDKLKLAEAWIQHDLKDPGFQLSFPQGSYSTGVAASAGTHSGGGAVDTHCIGYPFATKVLVVHWLRAVGFAAWHRPPNWDNAGGSEHIHSIEIGNPNLSSAAASQITQWYNHTNGLASHGADSGSVDVAAGRPARVTSYPSAVTASHLLEQNMSSTPVPPGFGANVTGGLDSAAYDANGVVVGFPEHGRKTADGHTINAVVRFASDGHVKVRVAVGNAKTGTWRTVKLVDVVNGHATGISLSAGDDHVAVTRIPLDAADATSKASANHPLAVYAWGE